MKSIILIITILILNNSANSQTKWQWQNPLPQGNSYSDICFLDSLNGFISGGLGTILKTTNGGKNWQILETNFEDHIKKISFIDLNNGWVMCYSNSTIYRTTDSGETWDLLGQITNNTLYDFRMINYSLGFACGSDSKIFKTTDGAVTWEQKEPPFFVYGLNTIFFVNENIGYCGGGSPYLLKTVDGGESWQEIPLPFFIQDITVWSIHFSTANIGYICGYAADIGFILYTTNGGNAWTGGALINNTVVYDAYYKDQNTIWINASGKILYTTDGGSNWAELLNNIFHISFLDENNSWSTVNGNSIVHSNDGLQTYEYQTSSISHSFFNDVEIIASNNVFISGTKIILA